MLHKKADETPSNPVPAGSDTTIQVLISDSEAPDFAMRRFAIKPGGGMPLHTNLVQHEQYVLQGRARVTIGDEIIDVERDDVVFIPAGVPHSYESTGSEDFVFLCMVPNRADRIDMVE